MRIGDDQVAIAIDRHAGGPPVLVIWRLPGAEEIAVAIEHLNSRGHVDNVKTILFVDGHRPWLLKPAIGNAKAAPNAFQRADVRRIAITSCDADQSAQARQCSYDAGSKQAQGETTIN